MDMDNIERMIEEAFEQARKEGNESERDQI